jgi:adenylylsulfate kinase-like enzyme
VVICYIFLVLVCRGKKNLATLETNLRRSKKRLTVIDGEHVQEGLDALDHGVPDDLVAEEESLLVVVQL